MSAEDRHELRKRLKTLRYAGTFLRSLYPGKKAARYIDSLAELQDLLLADPEGDHAALGLGQGGDSERHHDGREGSHARTVARSRSARIGFEMRI